jgi:hypothetical protein
MSSSRAKGLNQTYKSIITIFLHLTKLIGKKNVGGIFLLEVCKFSYETANGIQQ